ncbi:L,D-transpeptidase [Phaeobacter marinintestinus]|uniref:L,D-transpeptidase n=1 Tax=Falsiphaeobacter marinintestinus TaxID=1492905 RepID=UPI0011B61DFA|nr:L,D-transpeptidase [Phaeobacter marinintestinus]
MTTIPGWADQLRVYIDKSEQMMSVSLDDELLYRWPVSTARPGKVTPNGVFTPQSMKRMHYSTLYNNAPMPFSIFFSGNYAIHGTTQIKKLGCVASAGCIRLHPDNAEILFNMTLEAGMPNTRIIIRD